MPTLFNARVSKSEYDNWLAHLESSGYNINQEHVGGLLDSTQVRIFTPNGEVCTDYGAVNFMDAEKGRRVYMLQIRPLAPPQMHAVNHTMEIANPG